MHGFIVRTHRVQGLCDSWVHDVNCDVRHIFNRALISKAMVQWHVPIKSIAVQYGLMGYRLSMLRAMDVFPTLCHYDTQSHGRVVLIHAPQDVVITMVIFLLGEDRSASQPMLPLSGSMWEGQYSYHPLFTRRGRKGRMWTQVRVGGHISYYFLTLDIDDTKLVMVGTNLD